MELFSTIVQLLIAAVCLLALAGMAGLRWFTWLNRERGPWVVTRVGVGGREFYIMSEERKHDSPLFWSLKSMQRFPKLKDAKRVADAMLADVHLLSHYVGGVR
jgi:hypothetical protein